MAITGIDHLYAETRDWEAAAAFWGGLGFEFTSQWGSAGHRAGRLESGQAAVVLAEIPPGDTPPACNVFFDLEDADEFDAGDAVVSPLEVTHWGTRWIRVADPEGRVHCLEERSGS
jgi:catechol 2,3-dioxygenase-like lactoylglutathione lyase family enzyme